MVIRRLVIWSFALLRRLLARQLKLPTFLREYYKVAAEELPGKTIKSEFIDAVMGLPPGVRLRYLSPDRRENGAPMRNPAPTYEGRETKVESDPDALVSLFRGLGFPITRIGIEKRGHCRNGCSRGLCRPVSRRFFWRPATSRTFCRR